MRSNKLWLMRNKYVAFACRELIHRLCPSAAYGFLTGRQDNPYGESAYTLTFDFDFEKDISAFPRILDLLHKYDLKAGMAVIGKFVEKYPDIHKRAVDEGHEIINHSYTHPDNPHWAPGKYFNKLSYEEQKAEVEKAHVVIKDILGVDCIGFRTPHYGILHTESVYKILSELGYRYSSSTAACAFPGYGAPLLYKHNIYEIPTGCSLNFPLAIFDSWNMLRKKRPFLENDQQFIQEFTVTIDHLVSNSYYLTHYFDPYDVVENGKLEKMLKKLCSVKTVLYEDMIEEIDSQRNA
ncbi:polysaccharide deacetylase family protein [Maridesulfovibrio sp. FT414]|uniref:polysaccharide deacetylase family protein n=1 Tax=Maridesulfovibrio sp. FT414 TaxID=2979469 RepID=UPI003D808DAC